MSLEYVSGVSWPPTPKDFQEPSHDRVFREKFPSVYAVKAVLSLLTDLFAKQAFNLPATAQSKSGTGHVTTGLKHSYGNKNEEEHKELQPSVFCCLPAEPSED